MNKARSQKAKILRSEGMEASEGEVEAQIVPFSCTLSNLKVIVLASNRPETILNQAEPIALKLTVEFGQSGAIALMPLGLTISVEFFAKPLFKGDAIALGTATQQTLAKQFNYTFTVSLSAGLAKTGLMLEEIFQLCVLLRVGAPNYPALIHGVLEGVTIQTYQN